MLIHVLTLFPELVKGPLQSSILGRAQQKHLVEIEVIDIRDFTTDKHRTADDYPFGGGAGMVMKPEPIFRAFDYLQARYPADSIYSIFMTPQGYTFTQNKARQLAEKEHLVILCGHYEGVDERVRQALIDEEISIGDYILTGGELPALVVIDAVVRLIPGVLGNAASAEQESFSHGTLDYPQYTRPREYRGMSVPAVLLSGNHAEIERWRREQALKRTRERRPDLWRKLKEEL